VADLVGATVLTGTVSLRSVWQADIHLRGVRVPEENRLALAHSFRDTGRVLATTLSTCAWMAFTIWARGLSSAAP